jgi:YHS domain-containing protein
MDPGNNNEELKRTMRKIVSAVFVLTLLTAATALAAAPEGEKKNTTNKMCPVSGGSVVEKYRTEYKGQFVYLCCEGCVKEFDKTPEQFVAKMSKEEQEAIQTNKVCPVSGEPVVNTLAVENEGRKVYFCCEHCKDKYKKDHPSAK